MRSNSSRPTLLPLRQLPYPVLIGYPPLCPPCQLAPSAPVGYLVNLRPPVLLPFPFLSIGTTLPPMYSYPPLYILCPYIYRQTETDTDRQTDPIDQHTDPRPTEQSRAPTDQPQRPRLDIVVSKFIFANEKRGFQNFGEGISKLGYVGGLCIGYTPLFTFTKLSQNFSASDIFPP